VTSVVNVYARKRNGFVQLVSGSILLRQIKVTQDG